MASVSKLDDDRLLWSNGSCCFKFNWSRLQIKNALLHIKIIEQALHTFSDVNNSKQIQRNFAIARLKEGQFTQSNREICVDPTRSISRLSVS